MFEEIFDKFFSKNKEIRVIGVWGKDGLELEKKFFSETQEFDLEFTGAEIADILTKFDGIKISPDDYFIKLGFKEYLMMVFSLTPEYFLIIISEKGVFPGKLSFYLNLYKNNIVSVL